MDERRFLLDDKMRRAEKKREEYIEGIRRKAHEEDEKLKEIAFINELQVRQGEWVGCVDHAQVAETSQDNPCIIHGPLHTMQGSMIYSTMRHHLVKD